MHENLLELTNTPRRDVRIDRDAGILFDVKILGCSSRNGRDYPNETLRDAIPLYENSKVNLDHPEGDPRKPRSYQNRFGVIRNVRLRDGEGLFGDFRFNPKHAVAEQLLWDAENAPENVGFSHNVEAIVHREQDRIVVEKIVSVRSVDLVADPATTAGLFESVGGDGIDTYKNNETTVVESRQKVSGRILLLEAFLERFQAAIPGLRRVADPSFLDALDKLDEPELMQRLIENQIHLLEDFQQSTIKESRPICREQSLAGPDIDSKEFVKLLCCKYTRNG